MRGRLERDSCTQVLVWGSSLMSSVGAEGLVDEHQFPRKHKPALGGSVRSVDNGNHVPSEHRQMHLQVQNLLILGYRYRCDMI